MNMNRLLFLGLFLMLASNHSAAMENSDRKNPPAQQRSRIPVRRQSAAPQRRPAPPPPASQMQQPQGPLYSGAQQFSYPQPINPGFMLQQPVPYMQQFTGSYPTGSMPSAQTQSLRRPPPQQQQQQQTLCAFTLETLLHNLLFTDTVNKLAEAAFKNLEKKKQTKEEREKKEKEQAERRKRIKKWVKENRRSAEESRRENCPSGANARQCFQEDMTTVSLGGYANVADTAEALKSVSESEEFEDEESEEEESEEEESEEEEPEEEESDN